MSRETLVYVYLPNVCLKQYARSTGPRSDTHHFRAALVDELSSRDDSSAFPPTLDLRPARGHERRPRTVKMNTPPTTFAARLQKAFSQTHLEPASNACRSSGSK